MIELPIRAGIVGAGNAGQRHVGAMAEIAAIELAVIVDIDIGAARALANNVERPCATSTNIEGWDCMLWSICTPPATHAAVALRLLSTGATILIEKPPCRSASAARSLLKAVSGLQARCFVVSQHRFAPATQLLRTLIRSGEFGAPLAIDVRVRRCRGLEELGASWKSDVATAGGGVLISVGYHVLDLVLSCLGPIEDIGAIAAGPWPGRSETRLAAVGRIGDAPISFSIAVGRNATLPDEIMIDCEEARVVWRGDELLIDDRVIVPRASPSSLHGRQIAALIDLLRNGTGEIPTLEDGIATLSTIEVIYASCKQAYIRQ